MSSFGEISINVKLWNESYAHDVEKFLSLELKSSEDKGNVSSPHVVVVGEHLGTMEGSGCAVMNVVKHMDLKKKKKEKSSGNNAMDGGGGGDASSSPSCSLALLAAGEGSRLWGVSCAVGFIKGALNVAGKTLLLQSVTQASLLLESMPKKNCQDWVVISGTDNVFQPSKMPLRLADASSTLLSQVVPTKSSFGLFTFSLSIALDDPRLPQLGAMAVDSTGAATFFLEKPSVVQVRSLCREENPRIFVNAFVFALSRKAARAMQKIWGQKKEASGEKMIWEKKEFDWSGHVLTPLALMHGKRQDLWYGPVYRNETSKKYFPNDADWTAIWECAEKFYASFGPIQVIDCGADSVWFDCGLCSDVLQVHRLAFTSDVLRGMFQVDRVGGSNLASRCTGQVEASVAASSTGCHFVNCRFEEGVVVKARDCVFINCLFKRSVALPEDCIDCLFYAEVFDETVESKAMVPKRGTVYFAFPKASGSLARGTFPVDANPKYGNLLEAKIDGLNQSFRDIQKSRDINLERILLTLQQKY